MSAEVLRQAATELRATVHGCLDPSLVSDPEFKLAVADWLDYEHANLSTYNATTERMQRAFAVARAYIGSGA